MSTLNVKNLKSLFLISFLILLPLLTLNSYPNWGDDWAHYLAQAKSIAENSFSNFQEYYRFTNEFSSFKNPTVTPWGYPMLASIIYKLNGSNHIGFALQQIFFLFIFYIILFFGFRNKLNTSSRLILISIFGLNIFFLKPLITPSTDYLYLTLSTISIIGIYNFFEKNYIYFNKYIDIILISLLVTFAQSTREIGISLYLTIFIIQAKNLILNSVQINFVSLKIFLKEKFITYLIPYLILIIFNSLINNYLPNDSSFHVNEFFKINFGLLIRNFLYYLKLPAYFFSNYAKVGIFFYLACLYPFFIGFKKNFKFENTFVIYIFIYLSILLTFPHVQGIRFIYPILPFLFYYVLSGSNILFEGKYLKVNILRKSYLTIIILLLTYWFFSLINFQINIERLKSNSPYSNSFKEVVKTIKIETNQNEKILFFKPFLLKYLTERDSFSGLQLNQIYKSDYFLHYKYSENSNLLVSEANNTEDLNLIKFYDNERFTLFKILMR